MENLYKYYNKKDWQSFYQNVVAKHWQNHKDIYDHLTNLNIFDDDVCKSIAPLLPRDCIAWQVRATSK